MIAQRLAAALRTGMMLDLIPNTPTNGVLDEDEMRGWGDGHDVDAELLRALLLPRGLAGVGPDPHGLHLRGVRIHGRLDLDHLVVPIGLLLEHCLLADGVTAEQAHLPALRLHWCRLGHPDRPALHAERLQVDGPLDLRESVITAATVEAAVRLGGARIGGELGLGRATVRNSEGPALDAENLETRGDAFLDDGFTADGATIRLRGARIVLRRATVRNPEGPALDAENLETGGDAFLDEGFTADGAGADGAIRLHSARIGGQLGLGRATLSSPDGPALNADRLQTGGDAFLDEGFTADATRNY